MSAKSRSKPVTLPADMAPISEQDRLAAVHAISSLDATPNPALDRIVAAATELFGAKGAVIGLTEEKHHRFLAWSGLSSNDLDRRHCPSPGLNGAPSLIVVADASADPHTRSWPVVVHDPGIRFLAAAALRSSGGAVIGALWVFDTEPRPAATSAAEMAMLEVLASAAVAELERRLAIDELDKTKARHAGEMSRRDKAFAVFSTHQAQILHFAEATVIGLAYGPVRGPITVANSAFRTMLGLSREDIASGSVTWSDLTPDEWKDADRARLAEAERTGHSPTHEKEFFHKDGHRVPVMAGYTLDLETRSHAVVFVVDLSERKVAADRLQRSDARLQLALEIGAVGIFDYDLETREADWSDSYYALMGYARDEVVPGYDAWLSRLHPDDRSRVEAQLQHAVTTQTIFSAEFRVIHPNGAVRMLKTIAQPLADESGVPRRMLGAVRDVTDQHRALADLADREELLRLMFETIEEYAIYALDAGGRVATWNGGAERLKGYGAADVIGRHFSLFFTPEDRAADLPSSLLGQATRDGRAVSRGVRVRADGSRFMAHCTLTALRDAQGRLRGFSKITRDLTAQLRAETELQRANDDLMRVSRLSAMGAMASTIAHELNQPLASITNYLGGVIRLIETQEVADPAVLEALADAKADALHAGEIIRRIRKFTATGEVTRRTFELRPAVAMAINAVRARDHGARIEFVNAVSPDLMVDADPIQIGQVLTNLLGNAAQAAADVADPRVDVSAEHQGGELEVRVADNGTGLSPAAFQSLFAPFRTLKSDGLGLGLPLCRTIIEAHGGRIWAEPPDSAGATFCFTLPLGPS